LAPLVACCNRISLTSAHWNITTITTVSLHWNFLSPLHWNLPPPSSTLAPCIGILPLSLHWNSCCIEILPHLNFVTILLLSSLHHRHWNFAPTIIGISPSPSLEFRHCHHWNFATTVIGNFATTIVGISPSPSLEFCHCHHWNFATAIVGISPPPSLEFRRRRHWNFAVAVVGTVVGISPSLSLELVVAVVSPGPLYSLVFRQSSSLLFRHCRCFASAVIVPLLPPLDAVVSPPPCHATIGILLISLTLKKAYGGVCNKNGDPLLHFMWFILMGKEES
jgi:hypothetical protein